MSTTPVSITGDALSFFLAEHKGLRDEIIKRSEIQHQLLSITLVAFAALVSVGLKEWPTALLAYPLLAFFLSAVWSAADFQIQMIGTYILEQIECPVVGNLGWEHFIRSPKGKKFAEPVGWRAISGVRGIFLGTEILTVASYVLNGLNKGWPPMGDIGFLVLDLIAIVATYIFLWRSTPRARSTQGAARPREQGSSSGS